MASADFGKPERAVAAAVVVAADIPRRPEAGFPRRHAPRERPAVRAIEHQAPQARRLRRRHRVARQARSQVLQRDEAAAATATTARRHDPRDEGKTAREFSHHHAAVGVHAVGEGGCAAVERAKISYAAHLGQGRRGEGRQQGGQQRGETEGFFSR